MSSIVEIACAVGSAAFNGSFAALFKTKKMAALSIHPMVFQLYVCMGVFLSSWLVVPLLSKNPEILHDAAVGNELRFSPFGLIGGFLLVLALSASFSAVNYIGVALAQGIWGGGAMVVSYVWGIRFGEVPSRLGLSILGLFLLVTGVFGIVFSERIGNKIKPNSDGEESVPLTSLDDGHNDAADDYTQLPDDTGTPDDSSTTKSAALEREGNDNARQYMRGVLCACAVGLSGGSILAPLHYVPPEEQGLVFLPSFGIGALLLSPAVFYAHTYYAGQMPQLHVREALANGLLSGLIWNIGNLLSIIAIPAVGYGVAYPIYQCAILVSGAIGIYVFKEITQGTTIFVFWLGGAILLIGGTMLAAAQS